MGMIEFYAFLLKILCRYSNFIVVIIRERITFFFLL